MCLMVDKLDPASWPSSALPGAAWGTLENALYLQSLYVSIPVILLTEWESMDVCIFFAHNKNVTLIVQFAAS